MDYLFEARQEWGAQLDKEAGHYDLEPIKPEYHPNLGQCIYNVRADVDFRLKVITHQSNKLLAKSPLIRLTADSAVFTGETAGSVLVDSPYNEESLFLRSKRATESSLTAVEFEAGNEDGPILAAKPRLLIKVDPLFTRYLLWIAILLALGQFFFAVNQEMLGYFCITSPIWVPLSKLIGFLFTFVGVGLAFRKMKIP